MKLSFLSLCIFKPNKIIKNINIPSCKNCIYYKPNILHNDFTSTYNKCEKFGEKDIITDEITYKFANFCRDDESMCGKEGKYFEEEKNIKFKSNLQANIRLLYYKFKDRFMIKDGNMIVPVRLELIKSNNIKYKYRNTLDKILSKMKLDKLIEF